MVVKKGEKDWPRCWVLIGGLWFKVAYSKFFVFDYWMLVTGYRRLQVTGYRLQVQDLDFVLS